MLGLSDKDWLIDMLQARQPGCAAQADASSFYDAYFGLGHCIRLADDPRVFKVSLAGLALGAHLLRLLSAEELMGRFLDMGTGSGALALLLRSIGATDIVASDLIEEAVGLAAENEILNFGDALIRFSTGDLFDGLAAASGRFDTIVFNPPGWRAPSDRFRQDMEQAGNAGMALESMFYGDRTLLRFLLELPAHLHSKGRAIIGVNSLVGIQDVFKRYRAAHAGMPPLSFSLLERHSFPLLLYTDAWSRARTSLLRELVRWREESGAAYSMDREGNLYWSYEIIECRIVRGAGA